MIEQYYYIKLETLFDMERYSESLEYFNKVLFVDASDERAKEGVSKVQERVKKLD